MRHLNAYMGIFLLMAIVFIPQVCAWTSSEFTLDNAKQLEKNSLTTYGKYEITEHQWWDIAKIFTEEKVKEVTLKENTEECSDNCFAIKEVINLKPMPLIDDVRFYREIDGKWILWNGFTNWKIEVEEDVDLFETQCVQGKEIIDEKNGTSYFEQDCSQVKIGTEKRWLPLDYKKDYEGTYRVKLSGGKKASVKYDWQVKMNGVWSEEWAVWGAVIGVGGVEASVTLNSPANNSIQYTNPVTLSASANVTGGVALVNATLYDNSTGSWGARNVTTISKQFILTLSAMMSSGSYSTYAGYILKAPNGTTHYINMGTTGTPNIYTTDSNPAAIRYAGTAGVAFNSSINLTAFLGNQQGVWNISAVRYKTDNGGNTATLVNSWYSFNGINYYSMGTTGSTTSTSFQNALSVPFLVNPLNSTTPTITNTYNAGDVIDWNMQFCDSDGDCGFAPQNFTFSIPFYESSRLYNTTTYETKNETFLINLTANSSLTNVYLNYNGIDYLTTKSGDIYSKTLPMELVATDTNRTFYYKFEYAGTNITSPTSIQLVKNYLVNWTGTKQYINLTIKDEYDNTIINSTTMDTLFDYYIDSGGYTNIHQEIKVEDGIFGLNSTPNILKWSMFGRLYYYATGYQPRYFFLDNEEVTNTTITQKTLYLLLQTDGILARYKIYDNIGNELENVRISAYKKVGSSEILVEQVLTDSLGEASLFLNPNYYHRIVITYDDCTSIDRTRRITSSDTYTEFMTCGAVGGNSELNLTTFENVTSSFSPYSPVQYTNNTVTFSFTSSDSNCNLDETTYILKFGGTNLISLTGNNPCGQTLSQSVNLENYSGTLIGYGIMKIGNSQITLTKQYKVLNINNVLYNQTSVNSLLDKLRDPTFGLEIGLTPTTKALICFLILFGLIASFGNLTNKDNIPIMLVLVCLFLFVCSYMNFLTVFNSEYDWLNQYGILFLMGIFSSGIIIRRYA